MQRQSNYRPWDWEQPSEVEPIVAAVAAAVIAAVAAVGVVVAVAVEVKAVVVAVSAATVAVVASAAYTMHCSIQVAETHSIEEYSESGHFCMT